MDGTRHGEAFRRRELQQLGHVEQGDVQVIAGLDSRQAALGQCGGLPCHLGFRGLSIVAHGFQADHLQGVDLDLSLGDGKDLLVVENLDIGLGHGDADVIACFFQVLGGRLEVQLAQFDVVLVAQAVEERHVGTQAQARIRGIGIGVGIVGGQAAAERKVLRSAGRDAGQEPGACRSQVDLALAHLQGALLHRQAMVERVVGAVLQRPGRCLGRFLGPGGRGGQQHQGDDYKTFHDLFLL